MKVPGIPYVQGRNDYGDADGKHFGIAIHNTSNDASDSAEASFAARRTDGISAHFYADRNSVTQSLDTNDRAGHAGSRNGNENSIAVEITGANGWSRQQWLTNVDWDELGRVLAYIIKNDPDYRGFQVRRASVAEMKTNPRVKALYGHDDMRRAWGGTTHTDPGPNFPWDRLIEAVNKHLSPSKPAAPIEQEGDDMARLVVVAREKSSPHVWAGDFVTRTWIQNEAELKNRLFWLKNAGIPDPKLEVFEDGSLDAIGKANQPPFPPGSPEEAAYVAELRRLQALADAPQE